jgi:hypothetical protein
MAKIGATKKPSVLRSLWEGWKRVAKRVGELQARVLLTFFYFIVLSPFALAIRRRSDPLCLKVGTLRGWQIKDSGSGVPLERATRQF